MLQYVIAVSAGTANERKDNHTKVSHDAFLGDSGSRV